MGSFLQDLRHGLRNLASRPGFAIAAVLALGLGLGANTAIFSVVDAVVLSPLPYEKPERLVMLWETNAPQGLDHERVSPVNFLDYRDQKPVFEDIAAWWHPEVNLTDELGEPIRVNTIEASRNLFQVVGVAPAAGRSFTTQGPDLHHPEAEVVISDAFWARRYGRDPALLGRTLQLNGRPFTVVGVMPPGYHFPGDTDIWQGLGWNLANHSRFAHFMESVARLAPGVTLGRAGAELAALSGRLATEHADSNKDWVAKAVSLQAEVVGDFRPRLLTLLVAVGLLLLLACANVANLLLARASTRDREVALRSALGAGRGRLLRQFLTESLLLASAGAALGLGLAWAAVRAFAMASPIDVPRLAEVAIDGRVLLFCLGATLLTALLFGVAPALQMSTPSMHAGLKEGGRGTGVGPGRRVVRAGLVVLEVAVAVVLLVGAGLLGRSFLALLGEKPGFEPAGVVTANVQLPGTTYGEWTKVAQFSTEIVDRLAAHPQIESAGGTGFLPLEAGWRFSYTLPDQPPPEAGEAPEAQIVTATHGYFETLGIPLVAGRTFNRFDTKDTPGVMVVNRAMARRAWPNEEAVGKRLVSSARGVGPLARSLLQSQEYEVVGVVGDVKNNSLTGEVEPTTYVVATQFPYRTLNVVVRGEGGASRLGGVLREEVRRLDPQLALSDVRTGEQILSGSTASSRFSMVLMGAFAALALLLAAVGIYGVLSYTVAQRRGEIGVRLALGAPPAGVRRLVVAEGMALAGAGAVLGCAAAFGLARFMASLLFGIQVADLPTYGSVAVLILAVSLAACYLPARRASAVDPLEALRAE